MTRYDDAVPLAAARERYFRDNGFAADGGYSDKWVKLQMGPIALRLPNTPQRVRSVRYHDLHHVVTDYATDWTGEAEIAAWEIASGCADHHAAWLLNLWAMAIGLVIAPGGVWRAFRRGRRSHNLYREAFCDALLGERVGEMRARLGLTGPAVTAPGATLGERAAFLGWSTVSLALAVATLALLAAPFAIAARLVL